MKYSSELNLGMMDGSGDVFEGKRVLITGGGGYFGNELGNELKKQGAEVVLFDVAWPFDVSDEMKCVQVRIPPGPDPVLVLPLSFTL